MKVAASADATISLLLTSPYEYQKYDSVLLWCGCRDAIYQKGLTPSITEKAVTFNGSAIFPGIENKSSYKDVFPDTFFM